MERIHKRVGGCGPFQVIHVLLVQSTRFAIIWFVYIMMFGNYDPGWRCVQQRSPENNSAMYGNYSANYHFNVTESQDYSTENKTGLLLEFNYSVHQSNASTCDLVDTCDVIEFDSRSRTIVSEFHLICDREYISSLIISIQMVGMLAGSLVSGQIGEWFGRKVSLYSSVSLCAVSTFLAIFSLSWKWYAMFMFFGGAGASGIIVTNGLYTMEFLLPKWRGRMGSLPTWNVSFGLFAVVTYFLRNWVYIHIATASIAGLACIGVFWTSESLGWLLVHKKEKTAEKVVKKIMKLNRREKDNNNLSDIMDELCAVDEGKQLDRKYTYLDLFRSRQIFIITIKASFLWIAIVMTYFALSFNVKSLAGDFYVTFLIAGLSEIPVVLTVGPFSNRLGRRPANALFLLLAGLGCVTIVVSHFLLPGDVSGYVIKYSTLFAKAALSGSVNAINLFSVELYPTAIRSLAMAFLKIIGNVGSIVAPYLIPSDKESLVIAYILIGVMLFLGMFVTLSLPETKGRPLRDSLSTRNPSTVVNGNDAIAKDTLIQKDNEKESDVV